MRCPRTRDSAPPYFMVLCDIDTNTAPYVQLAYKHCYYLSIYVVHNVQRVKYMPSTGKSMPYQQLVLLELAQTPVLD